jgi:hypothetical protein
LGLRFLKKFTVLEFTISVNSPFQSSKTLLGKKFSRIFVWGIIYGGAVGGDLKGLEKIGGEGVFVIRSAVLL